MKELYCFLHFISNEKQLLWPAATRVFCMSPGLMQPNPYWILLSEWNSDFKIWSLQRSEVPRENFLYWLDISKLKGQNQKYSSSTKKKCKTRTKYYIMLLKVRNYSQPGNARSVAGGGSASQFIPFLTRGDLYLILGSSPLTYPSTHQCWFCN